MHDVRSHERSGSNRFAAAIVFAIAATLPVPARAQPRAATEATGYVAGTVLAIQGEELVLDLAAGRGARDGLTIEIWRPVKLKHPVTGKVLTDRFRIGSLELIQVRGTMSLARASGQLTRPAAIGDVVLFAGLSVPVAPIAPSRPPKPGEPEPAAVERVPEDPDARAVTEMFESLKGADLATRIKRYEAYAHAKPSSRFVRVLAEEAAALRELMQSRNKVVAREPRPEARHAMKLSEAHVGAPVRITVELNDAATGAILHVRRKGAPTYVSTPMVPSGPGYWKATIPGDRVVAPTLEYFVEGVAKSGGMYAVVGTASAPREIDVFAPPSVTGPRHLPMRVEIASDYADYNRWRHNDYVFQTEGWFGVRYGDTGIRALRLGFGVYRGVGGSVDDLDKRNLAGRAVGLTYGYLETEIGVVRAFSFIGRGAVGLVDQGISGGAQFLVRIGSDLGTNLVLGAEILGGVGLRSITQLELATFRRFPITLRSEVTNQPAGVTRNTDENTSGSAASVGVRGIAQLGFKITPDLVVAVRGSFQGRTIQHAGPGFGGAVGYSW